MNRSLLCLVLSCCTATTSAQVELRRYEVFAIGPHGVYDSSVGPNDAGEFLIKENGRIRFWSSGTGWVDVSTDFPRLGTTTLWRLNDHGLVSGDVRVNNRFNPFVYDARHRIYCEPPVINDVYRPLIDNRGTLGAQRRVGNDEALVHDRPFGQCTGSWTGLVLPANVTTLTLRVPRTRSGWLPVEGLVSFTQGFAGFATLTGFVPVPGISGFYEKNDNDQCLVYVAGTSRTTWAIWQNGQLGSRRWTNPWASGLTDRGQVLQHGTQFGAINYELATETQTTQLAALIDEPRLHWLRGSFSSPGSASIWGFGSFTLGRNTPYERIILRAKPGATLAINVSGNTISDNVGEPMRVPLNGGFGSRMTLTVQGGRPGNPAWIWFVDAAGLPWIPLASGTLDAAGELAVTYTNLPLIVADLRAYSWDPRGSVFGLPILDSPTRRIEVR